jgi:radical SAM superfamily enzyme YgiQ (UPF0313 family)
MGLTKLELFQPPVGLASVAAYTKTKGYDVEMHDLFDFTYEQAEDFLKNRHPAIVGITCVSSQHLNAKRLALIAKNLIPTPVVIVGGPHPSVLAEQVLRTFPVDYVVRGEGEITFLELIKAIENKSDISDIRGISYKRDREIFHNHDRELIEDLDSLPFPDYSNCDFSTRRFKAVLENEYYYPNKMRKNINSSADFKFIGVCSSRGCNNNCVFCYSSFWRGRWRFRSAENVVEEIVTLKKKFGFNHFSFTDDSFTVDPERVIKICDLILQKDLGITWDAGARVTPLSLNMLRLMKRAGCIRLSFGVESGSPVVLRNIRKNITPQQILEAFELAHQAGLPVFATVMGGNLGETPQNVKETIRLLRKCRPTGISCNPVYVMPGTELYRISKGVGVLDDDYWDKNPTVPIFTVENSEDRVRFYQKKILFFHYLYKMDIKNIVKIAGFLTVLKMGLILGIEANRIRDFLIDIPFVRKMIRIFTK